MITQFIQNVKQRGLARTNRYDVRIPLPRSVSSDMSAVATLFCDSATLPGANLSTTPMRTFGETREMPYEKIYDTVTLSFYVDADMRLKKMFENWMNQIYNPDTRTFGYYNNYVTTAEIYVRTVNDGAPYKLTLYEAYPKTLNSIQLDTAAHDIMKMSMTLQYKYWKSETFVSKGAAPQAIAANRGSTRKTPAQTTTNYPANTSYDPPKSILSVFSGR